MRRFTTFTTNFSHNANNYMRNLRNTIKPKQVVQTSMLSMLLLGNAHLMKQKLFSSKCTDAQPQIPKPEEFKSKFEPYTNQKYEEALAANKCVVIVIDNGSLKESFLSTLEEQVGQLIFFQKATKARETVALSFSPQTRKEQQEFEDYHKTSIPEGTILLLRNKYIKSLYPFTLEEYFNNHTFLFQYFRKLQKLSPKSIDNFSKSLTQLHSGNLMIAVYNPKSNPEYKKYRDRFATISLQGSINDGKNIYFLHVNDKEVADKLNLGNVQPGDIFILSKTSKYNFRKSTTELNGVKILAVKVAENLSGKLASILTNITKTHKDHFLFAQPHLGFIPKPWRITLDVNRNTISQGDYKRAVDAFAELKNTLQEKHPEIYDKVAFVLHKSDFGDKQGYRIVVSDETAISKDMQKPTNTNPANIPKDATAHSFQYKLPKGADLSVKTLQGFLEDAMEKKVPEYFMSQKPPKHNKYSQKIVGRNFKRTVGDGKDHVVFFYSNHCHGCKVYGADFEKLALENLKHGDGSISFERINSDKNNLDCIPAFYYTPVFMVIRKEEPFKPYVYRSPYFHITLLDEFIRLTLEHKVIPQDVEQKMFDEAKLRQRAQANKDIAEWFGQPASAEA